MFKLLLTLLYVLSKMDVVVAIMMEEECKNALGMENGAIKDEQIVTSSSHSIDSVGPISARIRKEIYGGAWCPSGHIHHNSYEWIEIRLRDTHMITAVEVQGRFANGVGREYADYFRVEYSRRRRQHPEDGKEPEGESNWTRYKDIFGKEIFTGNKNTYVSNKVVLNRVVIANNVRFIPHSLFNKTVCMRVELYGCRWKEKIDWYSLRESQDHLNGIAFLDDTYDGVRRDENHLLFGLGQLTDGYTGSDNYHYSSHEESSGQPPLKPGFDWVGWKNSSGGDPVQIIFHFQELRYLSSVIIHCSNFFYDKIEVFSRLQVLFSLDGRIYDRELGVNFVYDKDRESSLARNVEVDLFNREAKFVKLSFAFQSEWILLSEITFSSTPEIIMFGVNKADKEEVPHTFIVIAVLCCLILFSSGLVIILFLRHRCVKNKLVKQAEKLAAKKQRVRINMNDMSMDITNSLSFDTNSNKRVTLCATANNYVNDGNRFALRDDGMPPNIPHSTLPRHIEKIFREKFHESCPEHVHNRLNSYKESLQNYACPSSENEKYERSQAFESSNTPSPYATSSVLNMDLFGCCGNISYGMENKTNNSEHEMKTLSKEGISTIHPQSLVFVEHLGHGKFGQIHFSKHNCEKLIDLSSLNDFALSDSSIVIVKVLNSDANKRQKLAFLRELTLEAQLSQENITRMLGVFKDAMAFPIYAAYESIGNEDLHHFLRRSDNGLSYNSFLSMIWQISKAAAHIQALGLVHRDISCRNCLISHISNDSQNSIQIKLSNIAKSRPLYATTHYNKNGLPVRWMSWEFITMGDFTHKSDVWAYATTVWEAANFCSTLPFADSSESDVVKNAYNVYNFFHSRGKTGTATSTHREGLGKHLLKKPGNVDEETFDMMLTCWRIDMASRPEFQTIANYLLRKLSSTYSTRLPS